MKKGYIYILITTLLFSSMEVALKLACATFNPIQLTLLRFLTGSVILLPFALKGLKRRGCRIKANDLAFFALTGFILVNVSMILYQLAIIYSEASVVAVLFSCNPVFVIIFAFLLLEEKIHRHTVIAILFSLAGIFVIIHSPTMSGSVLGTVLSLLAAVTFALYGIVGRRRSQRYGSFALTCFSFFFGSMEMLFFIFLSRIGSISSFFTASGLNSFANIPILHGITLQSLPALIYIGVFVTGCGFTFYFLAMEETSAATASLVFFIKPVLAPLLALLVLSEPITSYMAAGIILIIIGSLISFIFDHKMSKKNNPPAASDPA